MSIEKVSDLTPTKIKAEFFEKINTIKDVDIREFVNEALVDAPNEFWEAPSSSSGNNHPPENNIPSGLLVHVIKALNIAESLFRFFYIMPGSIEEDIVRAAILLHDLYKQGRPWTNVHCKEHARVCANILSRYYMDNAYAKEKIIKCVTTHMSIWTEPIMDIKEYVYHDNLQLIVALSDYISSRNEISFYPGISMFGDKHAENHI